MARISLPCPAGWRDESVLRFVAPEATALSGRRAKTTAVTTASFTVSWEPADVDDPASAFFAVGKTATIQAKGSDDTSAERVVRYVDPVHQRAIQQLQRVVVGDDGFLYRITLSADPMEFSARHKDWESGAPITVGGT